MQTEVEKFFANVQKDEVTIEELSHPKEDKTEETVPGSQPEIKHEEEKPPQGGVANTPDENVPFHKHPRWIAREKEIADLKAQNVELAKFREEMKPAMEKLQRPAESNENPLPQWWKTIYGDTDESKQAFSLYRQETLSDRERMKQEILEDQQKVQDHQKEEVNKWTDLIETQITALREKGLEFDRNELLKVVDDYSKGADGNYLGSLISFEKAYEILQMQKAQEKNPAKDIERKKIAGKTSSDNSGDGSRKPTVNKIGSLAKRGWSDWN